MTDTLEYIDSYFNGELAKDEKKSFVDRCTTDPAFTEIVRIYVLLQNRLREQWAEGKRKDFAQLEIVDFSDVPDGPAVNDLAASLTKREKLVLRLLIMQKTSLEISQMLVLSQRTVDKLRSSIMQKLGVTNSVDMKREAIAKGLLDNNENLFDVINLDNGL